MSEYDIKEMLLSGNAPQNVRLLMAQGAIPLPATDALELLAHLSKDEDDEISQQALKTLDDWNESEILALLCRKDCSVATLDFFADTRRPAYILQAIAANPSTSGETVARLSATADSALLDAILDNRQRIIEFPVIIENIRCNPSASARILGLLQEIETEFQGEKRKDYSIESAAGEEDSLTAQEAGINFEEEIALLLSSPPPDFDLSLEGLPLDKSDAGNISSANITSRITSMPPSEKIKYALFGTREIRAILIRDTNREVARAVLRSPKLKESEVEGIAAMRGVSEDILREIGNGKEWLKNSMIVNNLVKNPKTPAMIAQRLMPRLRTQELALMARDRSIPDATRNNAQRIVKQRAMKDGGK